MFKKIIIAILALSMILSLCACGSTTQTNQPTESKPVTKVSPDKTISKTNAENHLKEKYPDKTFTFTNECYTASDSYTFTITDDEKNEYYVSASGILTGKEGIESAKDNVQREEMEQLVFNVFNKALGVDDISLDNFSKSPASGIRIHGVVDEKVIEQIKEDGKIPEGLDEWQQSVYIVATEILFSYTYVDGDKQLDLYNSSKDEKELFARFGTTITKMKKGTSKDIVDAFQKLSLSSPAKAVESFLPHIETNHTYLKDIKSFELLKPKLKTDGNLIYSKMSQNIEDTSFTTGKDYDKAKLEQTIKEIDETEFSVKNYETITPVYQNKENFDYYFKINEKSDDIAYVVCYEQDDGYDYKIVYNNTPPVIDTKIAIAGDYIFISNEFFENETNWFIVKCQFTENEDIESESTDIIKEDNSNV